MNGNRSSERRWAIATVWLMVGSAIGILSVHVLVARFRFLALAIVTAVSAAALESAIVLSIKHGRIFSPRERFRRKYGEVTIAPVFGVWKALSEEINAITLDGCITTDRQVIAIRKPELNETFHTVVLDPLTANSAENFPKAGRYILFQPGVSSDQLLHSLRWKVAGKFGAEPQVVVARSDQEFRRILHLDKLSSYSVESSGRYFTSAILVVIAVLIGVSACYLILFALRAV